MSNTLLNTFQERLIRIQEHAIQPVLEEFITEEDYRAILEFFTDPDQQALLEMIGSLPKGKSLHLPKEETGLPRTVNIVHGYNGKIKLFIELKSKRAKEKISLDSSVVVKNLEKAKGN